MPEKNSILLLNDIIYKIHTVEDMDEMRRIVLESLQFLVPNPISTFYLASETSSYELERPIGIGLPEERLHKYLEEYQPLDYTRWTYAAPVPTVYRETDLMRDEVRKETPYYKAMFAPSHLHYSAIMAIVHNGQFLGVINLFRRKEDRDFSDEEMLLFDLLKDHLGYRLFRANQSQVQKIKSYPDHQELKSRYQLTDREIEVVYLLLDGLAKDIICAKLSISLNTLKKHTRNIYQKMEIHSWRELFSLLGENCS